MKTKNLLILPMLLCGMLPAFAGNDASKGTATPAPAIEVPAFRAGAHEVELLGGVLDSLQAGNPRNRPKINYAIQAIRYGWMLNDVHGPSFLRGNDEVLLEGFGGEVFKGPGSYILGTMLLLRHNFVQDGSRLVPYIQVGAGVLDNDIYRNRAQTRVGEAFEFTLHGGVGIRWMINDRWALSTEAEYRHISNAGLAGRNSGLDSFGGTVGFNFFY